MKFVFCRVQSSLGQQPDSIRSLVPTLLLYRLVTIQSASEGCDFDNKEVRVLPFMEAEIQKTFIENSVSFQNVAQCITTIAPCLPMYVEN